MAQNSSGGRLAVFSLEGVATTKTTTTSSSVFATTSKLCDPQALQNPCNNIRSYSLQPLPLTDCRQYVLCQNYQETFRYTCDEGRVFSDVRKKCVLIDGEGEKKNAVCPCARVVADTEGENNNNDNDEDASMVQFATTTSSDTEAKSICSSASSSSTNNIQYPLLSTQCKDYAACLNGAVAQVSSCPEGLLFDSTIGACNWESMVVCPEYVVEGGSGSDVSGGGGDGSEETLGAGGSSNNSFDNTVTLQSIEETICIGKSYQTVPLPGCQEYITCGDGVVSGSKQTCFDGTLFDTTISGCNWATSVTCTVTAAPVATPRPTVQRTKKPTMPPLPTNPPFKIETEEPTMSGGGRAVVLNYIEDYVTPLNQQVFRAFTKEGVSYKSYWFQYQDFMSALRLMSGSSITGDMKHVFYLGEEYGEWEYGLVNVAMFLSQAMTESISFDACDEFHWETNTDGTSAANDKGEGDQHYAISNSCGRECTILFKLVIVAELLFVSPIYIFDPCTSEAEANYGEFYCAPEEKHMECTVDRNMNIQATTSNIYPNAPPPLTCRPRSTSESFTGFWDVDTGKESAVFPYENSFGRTDVEGCCYWGRYVFWKPCLLSMFHSTNDMLLDLVQRGDPYQGHL